MRTNIYQYEILKDLGDGMYEAKDSLSGARVTLYEWTPDAWEREKKRQLLEDVSGDLSSEVFSADASLYLISRDDAKAAKDLVELRSQGLFLNSAPPAPVQQPSPLQPLARQVPTPMTVPPPATSYPREKAVAKRSGMSSGAVIGIIAIIAAVIFLVFESISSLSNQSAQPSQRGLSSATTPITRQTPQALSQSQSRAATSPVLPTEVISEQAPSAPTDDMLTPLRRYEHGMLNNDPVEQASAYGPYLEKYYLQRNVDNDYVRNDKQAFLDHGNRVTNLAFEDFSVDSSTDTTAAIRYVRDVTWENASGSTHKLIRSLVHLAKFSDGWKIVYEQDFR